MHREFVVEANGRAVDRTHHLLHLTVIQDLDRIAAARLVYQDGSAADSGLPLADSNTFVPGATIRIRAGSDSERSTLFEGIVVEQALRIRAAVGSRLVVECRHAASRMTTRTRSAAFADTTDSDVIEQLAATAGLVADVEATGTQIEQLVQWNRSDWDFLLERAAANGMHVSTLGAGIRVTRPDFDAEPISALTFGSTLEELDATVDARRQHEAVKATAWDPAQQELEEAEATAPDGDPPGSSSAADLAAAIPSATRTLRSTVLPSESLQSRADAARLQEHLDTIRGTARCAGLPAVEPGSVVALEGVGEPFSGRVFVTGVHHEFGLAEGWRTRVQFGAPRVRTQGDHRSAPSGLQGPQPLGLTVGVVVDVADPGGEERVIIEIPLLGQDSPALVARLASPDAGPERGFVFRPEPGDEVLVGFFDGDPHHPVVLGSMHSSTNAAPVPATTSNDERVIQSRSGMRLHFDDATTTLTVETPGGSSVTLNDDEGTIQVVDTHGNEIAMEASGMRIKSAGDLDIEAGGNLRLKADASLTARSSANLELEGSGSASLKSPSSTEIRGGVVRIN